MGREGNGNTSLLSFSPLREEKSLSTFGKEEGPVSRTVLSEGCVTCSASTGKEQGNREHGGLTVP